MRVSNKMMTRGWRSHCGSRANCPPAVANPGWLRRLTRWKRQPGLDIVGYLLSEIGLGEAARLMVAALDAGGVPAGLINAPLPGRMSEPALAERLAASSQQHRTALTICGAPELGMFASRTCHCQVNIAYPFWELPSFPATWKPLLDGFDAYWAPTTFIQNALESAQHKTVTLVPQPIHLPEEPRRQALHGPLKFYTFFDFDSYASRKNPFGAIRAFRAAFPTGREDARLLVKARGRDAEAGRQTELVALARQDPRIEIIDKTLTREEMSTLMDECNVFVSLHRSEGFGLGCAEALARGKGVVATDFGGTRDFINERTGYPVGFTKVTLKADDYVGAEGNYWAEPSVEHAASIMRRLYDDPGQVGERALAGFAHLKAHNSFESVGRLIKESLA
ncbi:glycosyltransferase [Ancylobacter rudongensis]|uniref:Glycosyl transferases group 1 n=1 Tax=Ancylobacter rudongensis TaxID=177413 RepID=A0A1G4U193_9HYPH|nr:glycosyltransferase [Ancylobacter rudongensis]SCW87327.1 Glycosyl transferases group 1 [Ancylobacter rudongensis]